MIPTPKPTNEQVRCFMERRPVDRKPPLDQRELNRQLGRDLIEMARNGAFGGRR